MLFGSRNPSPSSYGPGFTGRLFTELRPYVRVFKAILVPVAVIAFPFEYAQEKLPGACKRVRDIFGRR